MTKKIKRLLAITLTVLTLFSSMAIPLASAATVEDDSKVSAYPTFSYCYDTAGNAIRVKTAMAGQYVGEYQLKITVDGKRVYCIEPGTSLGTSSYVASGTTSKAWFALGDTKQRAIQLAIACGLEGNADKIKTGTINTDQAYVATQLIIWEIVKGERNSSSPYNLNSGKSGYLSMFCVDGSNPNIKKAYNNILSAMSDFNKIPSFTGRSRAKAPTIELTANYYQASNTWTYSTVTKKDENGVLASSFGSIAGTYDVGNAKVKVTQTGNTVKFEVVSGSVSTTATSKTVTISKAKTDVPTKTNGNFICYYSDYYQDTVTGGTFDPPNMYLNIKVNVTNHGITRDGYIMKSVFTPAEDEDDSILEGEGSMSTAENIEGWYFYVTVPAEFKNKYEVDHIILGPTNELGITQNISDYIAQYLDKNVSYDIPSGAYYIFELGRLKDGVDFSDIRTKTGTSLASCFEFPDAISSSYPTYQDYLSGSDTSRQILIQSNSTSVSVGHYTNIYNLELRLTKTSENSSSSSGYYFEFVNNETGETKIIGPTANSKTATIENEEIADGSFSGTTAYIDVSDLEEGTYTVTELGKKNSKGEYSIPSGFLVPEPQTVEISAEAMKLAQEAGYDAIQLEFVNKYQGQIAVEKSDTDTGELLAGAVYGIYGAEENGELLEELTTDENGYAVSVNSYIVGTYYIQEITPPSGYTKDSTVYTVEVKPDNTKSTVELVKVTNEKTTTSITKTNITGEKEVEGAYLQVTEKGLTDVIDNWVSDTDAHIIRGLEMGKTYTLTETLPPNGYVTSNSIDFTINEDGSVNYVEMRDDVTKYEFVKTDTDGNLIKDVNLQVIEKDTNEVILDWVTDGVNNYTVEGELVVGKTYLLHEVSAPNRYKLADDIEFTVADTADLQTITMVNTVKLGSITLNKTDSSDNVLPNTEYSLFSSDNTFIKLGKTDVNGQLIFNELEQGNYYLVESDSNGKQPYAEKINFTVNPDNEDTLNTSIKIEDDNPLIPHAGGNGNLSIILCGVFSLFVGISIIAKTMIKKRSIKL